MVFLYPVVELQLLAVSEPSTPLFHFVLLLPRFSVPLAI